MFQNILCLQAIYTRGGGARLGGDISKLHSYTNLICDVFFQKMLFANTA